MIFLQLQKRKFKDISDSNIEAQLLEKMTSKTPIELVKESQPFRFGNYDKYYSFRYKDRFQDSRLHILNKDYFLNKDCLDIGCNDGSLTIMLAIKYFPKSMLGIDIDFKLINKAIDNLQFFEKQQNQTKPHFEEEAKLDEMRKIYEKLKEFPQSFQLNLSVPNQLLGNSEIIKETKEKEENKNETKILNRFPNNISFRIENFIQAMKNNEKFDTITCFSLSKWVHLNWGDTGIKRLFQKVYDSLNENGVFIFEPQEWKAYKKKKCINEDFKKIYKLIKLRPKDFVLFLEQELRFKLIDTLIPDLNLKHKGFKRPIYIYKK